ncbi:MAG: YceI family protein [Pseudomonadota bacterium]
MAKADESVAVELSPGQYNVVADRSSAHLSVKGALGSIQAQIPFHRGAVEVGGDGQIASASATLDARGLSSKNSFVEKQLRGRTGLDVDNHAEAHFAATSAQFSGDVLTIRGTLTVKGISKPIALQGAVKNARARRFVAALEGEIDRTEFGITAGRPLYGKQASVRLNLVVRKP